MTPVCLQHVSQMEPKWSQKAIGGDLGCNLAEKHAHRLNSYPHEASSKSGPGKTEQNNAALGSSMPDRMLSEIEELGAPNIA